MRVRKARGQSMPKARPFTGLIAMSDYDTTVRYSAPIRPAAVRTGPASRRDAGRLGSPGTR